MKYKERMCTNTRGKKTTRDVEPPIRGYVCKEHALDIYRLYRQDGLTQREIAELYGMYNTSVSRIVRRINRHVNGIGDENDRAYYIKAARYARARMILEKSRRIDYGIVAMKTGLRIRTVREIAERNGLER